MAAKKKTEEATENLIEIKPIDLKVMTIRVVGDTPLIVHAWADKAKQEMLDKQMKKASKGKEAKDPWTDMVEALYWLSDKPEKPTEEDVRNGKFGFPASAFKACAIDAGYQQGAIAKKTTVRGAFHIIGDMVTINGTPTMREDMVKIGGMTKVADIRYRPEFREWSAVLTIKFNPCAVSMEQIINLINLGGFSNGIGEWRPERDGSYGTFHVDQTYHMTCGDWV